jgi:hypothetical protein
MKLNSYLTQYWKMKLKKKLKNRLKKPKSATIKKIWDSILNQLNFERLNLERKKMI